MSQCNANEMWAAFPRESEQPEYNTTQLLFFLCAVQCSHVSIIHQTLTWTTGSLTCVHDHSYTYVYTQGLGTLTSQHILTWGVGGGGGGGGGGGRGGGRELSQIFLVLQTGFKPLDFGSRQCSTNWATLSPYCPGNHPCHIYILYMCVCVRACMCITHSKLLSVIFSQRAQRETAHTE